jgi:hypothetical protein
LAGSVPELTDYGQIKAPATEVLMAGAERWATATEWSSHWYEVVVSSGREQSARRGETTR